MLNKFFSSIVLLLALMMHVASATPITHQGANTTTISNWQLSWGDDIYTSGLAWVWDMGGDIQTPFQVKLLFPIDTNSTFPLANWITPHLYEGGYTFAGIDLLDIVGDTAYTNIGKGEAIYLPDQYGDLQVIGYTFQGVGLELTPVSSVPEPGSFLLLAIGLCAFSLAGKRRNILISRQC